MVSILKRLVLKEWLKSFGGAAAILFIIITVANLVDGLLRDSVSFKSVFFTYVIELPGNLMRVFPVSCLMASLFSINKLKGRNELAAIFASGFSRARFVLVLVAGSFAVALAQFSLGAYVGPYLKRHRLALVPEVNKFKNLKSKGLSAGTISSGKIWFKGSSYYFAFSSFDKARKVLHDVSLYYYDSNYKLDRKLEASKLTFQDDGRWRIESGKWTNDLSQGQFPTLVRAGGTFIKLEEDAEDFKQIESDITILDFFALKQYVDRLKAAGINTSEYEVMLYDIISSSLVCIIFALIASNGLFNPNRRASTFGKNLFGVFVFTLLYWLVYSYLLELGRSSKIDPLVACFIVPAIFGAYLVVHFKINEGLGRT